MHNDFLQCSFLCLWQRRRIALALCFEFLEEFLLREDCYKVVLVNSLGRKKKLKIIMAVFIL